jgi:hypothetical protein
MVLLSKQHMVLLLEMLVNITAILWVRHTSSRARFSNQTVTYITAQ